MSSFQIKASEERRNRLTKRTNLPPLDPFSQPDNLPGTLVPQAQFTRDLRAPDAAVLPEVHVAAADAGGGDVDQAFSRGGRWGGDLDDGELVGGIGCDGDVGVLEVCVGGGRGGGGHDCGSLVVKVDGFTLLEWQRAFLFRLHLLICFESCGVSGDVSNAR